MNRDKTRRKLQLRRRRGEYGTDGNNGANGNGLGLFRYSLCSVISVRSVFSHLSHLALLLVFVGLANLPALAQQRPLITEDVEIVKPGSARFEFGFDFLQDKNYPLSGLNGDLTRLGVISDRKSTRLNSSHLGISYAVFCLKKKTRILK